MKLIFFGSDDFAAEHLKALLETSHQIVACVTQPDKPKNRGMKIVFSPIKEIALQHNIPLLQPESFKDSSIIQSLQTFEADLFVVIAYGRILPKNVLEIPKKMAINVHGSLLPKYRGAAPINWAIVNGDSETGVSIIKMNDKMDAGEILASERILISNSDDAVYLRLIMAGTGRKLLIKTIDQINHDAFSLLKQDEDKVSLAPKLNKELGKIDWNQSAQAIHNLVRGLQPWPGAYTFYQGKQMKVFLTSVLEGDRRAKNGEVWAVNKGGLFVQTGKGSLLIGSIQLEGGKKMTVEDFMLGHSLAIGTVLE